jgi:hypothetical protein
MSFKVENKYLEVYGMILKYLGVKIEQELSFRDKTSYLILSLLENALKVIFNLFENILKLYFLHYIKAII